MQEINFTSTHKYLLSALQQPWTAIYTKVIAIALLYGATVHVGNILGLTGTPWLATPLLWRSLDMMLSIFDVVTALALWRGMAWSIWLLFSGIFLLQILYPVAISLRHDFVTHFILKPEDTQVLNSLLGTEILLLGVLVLLLWLRK